MLATWAPVPTPDSIASGSRFSTTKSIMEHHHQQLLHFSPQEHHHHHQLLHFSPQEHLIISPGFFDVGGADHPAHFHDGGGFPVIAAADIDDSGWMEDLMQLGGQLFDCEDNNVVIDVGDDQAWQQQCEGASPDQPSYDPSDQPSYDDVSPPSGEEGAGQLACEPSRDDGDLSATRKRRDRSKTIVSERKRRVGMKEKLYKLRSLVPNITKMDKASIIADAVVYVKNLQSHAKKLKEEVAMLERRPGSPGRQQESVRRRAAARRQGQQHGNDEGSSGSGLLHGARVAHVGAALVGEGRFFVTVECAPAGVGGPLCAAVESLACFRVENSNLGCSPDRVVSTLTLKVSEAGEEYAMISECTVKLWLMAALLKEGFRPEATAEIS